MGLGPGGLGHGGFAAATARSTSKCSAWAGRGCGEPSEATEGVNGDVRAAEAACVDQVTGTSVAQTEVIASLENVPVEENTGRRAS